MNWLAGAELAEGPRVKKMFETEESDGESLLVAFLTELVYFAEQGNIGFDNFDIQIKNDRLKVEMEGAPLKSLSKAIKAVTWHKLEIQKSARGLEVEIVFDVCPPPNLPQIRLLDFPRKNGHKKCPDGVD